jgi:cell wall-associated NlpC family hydrolase
VSALDRRLTPARADLAAERLRGEVEAPRYVAPARRRVIVECADLLTEPRSNASRDTQALFGEEVDLYDTRDGWAWVQLAGDGYVGYLDADALGPSGPPATHVVAVPRTCVYEASSIKSRVVRALPMNALVEAQPGSVGFLNVRDGFVFASHAVAIGSYENDFVRTAERFLDAPYLWGGKTWLGIDCSGLVQSALRRAGVTAPRDTDMQERALGRALDPDAPLARGDLVFWKGHVGLMRDGARLLHANGHHMFVASEALADVRARVLAAGGGDFTSVRRLD